MENTEIEAAQQQIDHAAIRAERLQKLFHETAEHIFDDLDNLASWVDNEATLNAIGALINALECDDAELGRRIEDVLCKEIYKAASDYAERKLAQEEEQAEILMQIGAARI